jgi:hypothetical protein
LAQLSAARQNPQEKFTQLQSKGDKMATSNEIADKLLNVPSVNSISPSIAPPIVMPTNDPLTGSQVSQALMTAPPAAIEQATAPYRGEIALKAQPLGTTTNKNTNDPSAKREFVTQSVKPETMPTIAQDTVSAPSVSASPSVPAASAPTALPSKSENGFDLDFLPLLLGGISGAGRGLAGDHTPSQIADVILKRKEMERAEKSDAMRAQGSAGLEQSAELTPVQNASPIPGAKVTSADIEKSKELMSAYGKFDTSLREYQNALAIQGGKPAWMADKVMSSKALEELDNKRKQLINSYKGYLIGSGAARENPAMMERVDSIIPNHGKLENILKSGFNIFDKKVRGEISSGGRNSLLDDIRQLQSTTRGEVSAQLKARNFQIDDEKKDIDPALLEKYKVK